MGTNLVAAHKVYEIQHLVLHTSFVFQTPLYHARLFISVTDPWDEEVDNEPLAVDDSYQSYSPYPAPIANTIHAGDERMAGNQTSSYASGSNETLKITISR